MTDQKEPPGVVLQVGPDLMLVALPFADVGLRSSQHLPSDADRLWGFGE